MNKSLRGQIVNQIINNVADCTDIIAYDIQGKMSKSVYNKGYKYLTSHVWNKVVVESYNHITRLCEKKLYE